MTWFINPDNPTSGAVRVSISPYTQDVTDAELAALKSPATLQDAIDQVSLTITQHADALRSQAPTDSTEFERAAWPAKAREAELYQASSDPNDAPLLQAEAIAASITLGDLAATVMVKATALYQLEAQISGNKKKHLNAIAAMADAVSVQDYNYSEGWPVI